VYQNSVLDANIEQWVELLGDVTFPTATTPLTQAHAQMFIDAYEHFIRSGEAAVPPQHAALFADLEVALDRTMALMRDRPDQVLLRFTIKDQF
jgi:hypothetical protein